MLCLDAGKWWPQLADRPTIDPWPSYGKGFGGGSHTCLALPATTGIAASRDRLSVVKRSAVPCTGCATTGRQSAGPIDQLGASCSGSPAASRAADWLM
jgi:hypothetical protein